MLNDTNPMSGLPSHNGIDVAGNPHGISSDNSNSHFNIGNKSSIHLNWWTWKVDIFLILMIIAANVYIFSK